MGLDASVRCRCFEEHRLKPGPMPYEDLYIDEEGYLASRGLDSLYSRYEYDEFRRRYGTLYDLFLDWTYNCCEHEDGEYCSERVSNWAGCARFDSLVEEVGGREEFPLLSSFLPHANGGLYPVEKAPDTLEELNRFIEAILDVDE